MASNLRVYYSFCSLIPETDKSKTYSKMLDLMTTRDEKITKFNYGDPGIKCAYFYLYFTISVYSVFETWKKFEQHAKVWIENTIRKKQTNFPSINIFCLGGNTGADTLGLYLWLRMRGIQIRTLNFFLNVHDWIIEAIGVKWLLFNNSDEPDHNKYHFVSFDLNKDILKENPAIKDMQADLITVVNIFSTTIIDYKQAVPQFRKLFEHLAPNGLVLIVDTNSIGFLPVIQASAQLAGLTCIDEFRGYKVAVPQHERDDISRNCFKLYSPQTETLISASLWQRCVA